jgi:hypothetical protein
MEHKSIDDMVLDPDYPPIPPSYLSEDALNSIFLNELKIPDISIIYHSPTMGYKLNSLGFRSEELQNKTKILFSGCSFTFGVGIPEEKLWTQIVAKTIDIKHQNIALPGSSPILIVANFFEYCRKYGNPEIFICLFPDFYRTFRVKNLNYGHRKYATKSDNSKDIKLNSQEYYENITSIDPYGKNIPKIIKFPTDIEDIMQPDSAYMLNMIAINLIDQYCKSNNIKFLWSTWYTEHAWSINKMKKNNPGRFLNFIDIKNDEWIFDDKKLTDTHVLESQNIFCHEDLMKSDKDLFYVGFDRAYSNSDAHWGSHRHQHVAEEFIKALND